HLEFQFPARVAATFGPDLPFRNEGVDMRIHSDRLSGNGLPASSFQEFYGLGIRGCIRIKAACIRVAQQALACVEDDDNQRRRQGAKAGLKSIGRDTGGYDVAVEGVVTRTETFVVRQAARLFPIVNGEYH